MLVKTRKIWKRRAQARIFVLAGMQEFLEERERNTLEAHMGFPGQFERHRPFQITQLKKLGLQTSSSVLEIGCGPLTAGVPVIDYLDQGRYYGVDVRSNVLDHAWQQVGKHGLSAKNPRLIRSDDFGNEALGDRKFDFIWSFSVLYHLTDELLDRLFGIVVERLAPKGLFIANVQDTYEDSTWLEFPFLNRSVETYAAVAATHGLKTRDLGRLKDLGLADSEESLLQFCR